MIKKWNWTLTILAIANIFCLCALGEYVDGLTQGMAIMGVFIFPIYILAFSILVVLICLSKKKVWFTNDILFSTTLMLFFCTPIPVLVFVMLSQPTFNSSESSEMVEMVSGSILDDSSRKTELDKDGGKTIAIRHWYRVDAQSEYLKDSTWVYFNDQGDTARIEVYKNDSLLFEKTTGK